MSAAASPAAVLPGVTRSPIGCTTEHPSPAAFTKWCAKRSVLWPKCGMAMSAATGRCVVATQDIKQGEVVIEVPDDAVLMGENCQIQELLADDGLLKPAEDALLEVQGLILAVMYEKALGPKSAWAPYLAFLPADMSHMPLYWSNEELEELRGTAAHDKMLGRVQHPADAPTRMSQLFEELVLPFVQSHGQACKVLLGGKGPEEIGEEAARERLWPAYCWATAAVASYSFVLGDDHYQGMVPVWDLLNHITGAVNVRLHHEPERGILQMIATQDITKGAEVVNCYGQLSNAELLRGYGYVEQHNSIQHVQIPAQFLVRAAAGATEGAAAAAAGADKTEKQGQQKAGAKAGAAKQQHEDRTEAAAAQPDGEEPGSFSSQSGDASDSDGGDAASSGDGDDDGSSSDAESSSDDEPDWDLEDDEEQLQKQQQQPVPPLHAAQQRIPDWEDRWQLCFSLKLLPKNGVFQVPQGGLDALPRQLLPVLLLMLAGAGDCEKLSVAAGAATSKAADAAAAAAAKAAAAAASASKGSKGGKGSSKQGMGHAKREQTQQKMDKGAAAADEVAAADSSSEAVQAAAAAAGLAAAGKELARVARLQLCAASHLHSALQLLVRLMQSRYSCSLEEDETRPEQQQQQQQQQRLAAAVLARVAEKRVLAGLAQALQQPAAQQQLMQQARQALHCTLQQLAQEAAAAAAAPAYDCCGVPGCVHEHHEHDHGHQHSTNQQQQQQQQPAAEGTGGKCSAGKKRKQQHADEDAQQQQQQQVGRKGTCKASHKAQKGATGKAVAAAGSSDGFAFNFQV